MQRTDPSAVRFALVAVALALVVIGQLLVDAGNLRWSIAPFAVAALAVALAAASTPSRRSDPTPVTTDSGRAVKPSRERTLGLACLLASLSLLGLSLWKFAVGPPYTLAWYAFGASVLLLLVVLPTIESRWTRLAGRLANRESLSFEPRAALPWLGLAVVLLLGLLVRLYDLTGIPPGMWHDEADNLIEAWHIQANPGRTPVFVPTTNLPSMFLLPIAAAVDLTEVSMGAGRVVSVLFGLAGVVSIFLLVRLIAGPFVAVIAAFLAAVMRWDLIWSRIGMHGITAPVFAALSAWLLLRALRSGRMSDFGFAGAALGLSMWFYAPLRLFPLVVGAILLHHLVSKRPRIRTFSLRIGLMAAVALMVAAPVIQSAAMDTGQFFARTRETSVFSTMPAWDAFNALIRSGDDHALMLTYSGDANPRHNIPSEPMLDFWSSVLLILGLAVALTRWRDVGVISLVLWLPAMALPAMLTLPSEAPQSLRAIGMIPAVAALAALGFGVLWTAGRSAPWPAVRRATPVVVAGLLAAIAFNNIDSYFGRQADDPAVYASFTTDQTLIARDMRGQLSQGYTLLTSRQFLYGRTLSVVAGSPAYDAIRAPTGVPIDPADVAHGAAIYLEPRERSLYDLLRVYYPDGAFREIRPPAGGDPLYYSAYITRKQLEARTGLDVLYHLADGSTREARIASTETLWPLIASLEEVPVRFEWKGALHVRELGEYELSLEGSHGVDVALDGRALLSDEQRSAVVEPAVGLHTIHVGGPVDASVGFIRLLWKQPGGALEPIRAGLYRDSVRPVGLAGRFFESGVEDGVPDAVRITPAMYPFYYDPVVPEPYLAVWDGTIHAEIGGAHTFDVTGAGVVRLLLDGVLSAQWPASQDVASTALVTLSPGDHEIRVEYESAAPPSQFVISWAPPGRALEPVPIQLLTPLPEHMFRILD